MQNKPYDYLLCRWERHLARFPHLSEVDRRPETCNSRARCATSVVSSQKKDKFTVDDPVHLPWCRTKDLQTKRKAHMKGEIFKQTNSFNSFMNLKQGKHRSQENYQKMQRSKTTTRNSLRDFSEGCSGLLIGTDVDQINARTVTLPLHNVSCVGQTARAADIQTMVAFN